MLYIMKDKLEEQAKSGSGKKGPASSLERATNPFSQGGWRGNFWANQDSMRMDEAL